MSWGGRVEREAGRVVAVLDRAGTPWIEAVWDGSDLLGVEVDVPGGGRVGLRPNVAHHGVLGPCHEVYVAPDADQPGRHLAWCARVDVGAPERIPAMDDPGAVPSGAGSAILDLLALHAAGPLRYRGPYPTGALFDALSECFTPIEPADPVEAFARFNARVDEGFVGVDVEPDVWFAPAPFERHREDGVTTQLRDALERAWLPHAGRTWSFARLGPRRLVPDGDGWRAVLLLGDAEVAQLAALRADGTLAARWSPPPVDDGPPVPEALRDAFARALPPRAPMLARAALADVLREAPLRFGDPGLDAVAVVGDGLVLHDGWRAALRAAPHRLDALAGAVSEAALRLATRRLSLENAG